MAKANYELPEAILQKVKALSGAKSKREAIVIALEEYLRKKQLQQLALSPGKIKLTWTQSSLRKHRD